MDENNSPTCACGKPGISYGLGTNEVGRWYCGRSSAFCASTDLLREKLADLEHQQWSHWTRYCLANLTPENIERWKRQCETPYSELSEKEKDSDREWADKAIDAMNAALNRNRF